MSTDHDMPTNNLPPKNRSGLMGELLTVLLKELRELSRDRRTLMLALMLPLLFPVLIIGMGTLAEKDRKSVV